LKPAAWGRVAELVVAERARSWRGRASAALPVIAAPDVVDDQEVRAQYGFNATSTLSANPAEALDLHSASPG
jgi:hypothetical protein